MIIKIVLLDNMFTRSCENVDRKKRPTEHMPVGRHKLQDEKKYTLHRKLPGNDDQPD